MSPPSIRASAWWPSPNGCFETVEEDDPIYERAISPRAGRVVLLKRGTRRCFLPLQAVLAQRGGESQATVFRVIEPPSTWEYSQRIQRLATAAATTHAGLPAARSVAARLLQRGSKRISRCAASMSVARNSSLPALINPASACRWPLEAFRGESPQYRDSCLPVRNRSKRPISARNAQAVTGPTPRWARSCATTGSP